MARLLLLPHGRATTIRWRWWIRRAACKGVQGLRVVDASIFPVVPCANTNFPVLMTAEKIADTMMQ